MLGSGGGQKNRDVGFGGGGGHNNWDIHTHTRILTTGG